MDVAIGVDIGGSAIKFAVVDQTGRVVWPPAQSGGSTAAARVSYSVTTPGTVQLTWQATGSEEVIHYDVVRGDSPASDLVDGKWVVPATVAQVTLKQVLSLVAESFSPPVAAVGIGATGLIGHDGIVREGYAFAGYRNTDWAAVAKETGFGGPVRVLNDARAAAWAEYTRIGSGDTFLHVTAGTRVGCAIVQEGSLLEGANGCAGEFSYQQFIGPDTHRYSIGARLMDCPADDSTAFGTALTGVIHVINPGQIVLRGFAPEFLASVQSHVDRYVFKTHWRLLNVQVQDAPGSMLTVERYDGVLVSTISSRGHTYRNGIAADFLSRVIVCAPLPLDRPRDIYFGEIAGSFGIEADYRARTGRSTRFDDIASAAALDDVAAAASIERAAKITAAGIVNACRMTGAQLVTVGGAVPLLYRPYIKIVSEYVTAQFGNDVAAPTIQSSTVGNDAGVIGAALYAMRAPMTRGPANHRLD